MKLLVGLGNPGAKYEKTRHNIGFLAVDAIVRAHGFSPERSKFQGAVSEGRLGAEKILVLKPMTFMNLSGQSVGEAMRFFRLEPEDVICFHDELDLAPGKLRVKTGGGHAGHNGLRSMHEHIGADFHRVRLGIGHPGDKRLVSAYVLHDFAKADWEWIDPLLDGIVDGAELLASGDSGGFMNKVALKAPPPKPKEATEPKTPRAASDGAGAAKKPGAGAGAAPRSDADAQPASDPAPSSPLEKLLRRFSKS